MQGRLRVGAVSKLGAIDPHRALHHVEGMVQRQVFESLYRRSDGRSVPDLLARRLRPAEDGGYDAPLREGLRFSDGSELDAGQVCASLERSGGFPSELRVEARGSTIWISAERSLAELRDILSSPMTAIAKFVGDVAYGTGSFVVAHCDEQRMALDRNPHHVGATASVEGVDIRHYGTSAELGHAFARGELDYTSDLTRDELPRGANVRTSNVPTPSTALLWINVERVPDPKVRQAIAHALDRRALLAESYPGVMGLSADSVAPSSFGSKPSELAYDPVRSRELLAGRRPTLRVRGIWGPRPYLPCPRASVDRIVEHLEAVGFEASGELVANPAAWRAMTDSGDFDLALGGWYAEEPSLALLLAAVYSSAGIPRPDSAVMTGCNFGRYDDHQTDQILTRFRATGDEQALDELAARVRAQCPVVALHHGATTVGLGPRVMGREFDELAFPVFSSFTLRRI